jgi:hypothetical protein
VRSKGYLLASGNLKFSTHQRSNPEAELEFESQQYHALPTAIFTLDNQHRKNILKTPRLNHKKYQHTCNAGSINLLHKRSVVIFMSPNYVTENIVSIVLLNFSLDFYVPEGTETISCSGSLIPLE